MDGKCREGQETRPRPKNHAKERRNVKIEDRQWQRTGADIDAVHPIVLLRSSDTCQCLADVFTHGRLCEEIISMWEETPTAYVEQERQVERAGEGAVLAIKQVLYSTEKLIKFNFLVRHGF